MVLAQFSSFLFWRISSEKLRAAIMISEASLHTKNIWRQTVTLKLMFGFSVGCHTLD